MDRFPTHSSPDAGILQHPTPSFEPLSVVNFSNIERLELTAETLSIGSEAGEAVGTPYNGEGDRNPKVPRRYGSRSRRNTMTSAGSHSLRSVSHPSPKVQTSFVDPGPSPQHSFLSGHSDSFSQSYASRARSGSKPAGIPASVIEGQPLEFGSPLPPPVPRSLVVHNGLADSEMATSDLGVETSSPAMRNESAPLLQTGPQGFFRNPSTTSQNTLQRAASLFRDFDGIHYSPVNEDVREEDEDLEETPATHHLVEDKEADSYASHRDEYEPLPQEMQRTLGSPASLSPRRTQPPQRIEPPPRDNMVYYPAPVPMTLTLPKRLSTLPVDSFKDEAQRRSQVLSSIPMEARKSAIWLPDPEKGHEKESSPQSDPKSPPNKRASKVKARGPLPPQLRASVFFDHPSVPHELPIQRGSAVYTLENMLDAAARAPVGRSVDLTRSSVMFEGSGPKKDNGKSTVTLLNDQGADGRASRLSLSSDIQSNEDLPNRGHSRTASKLSLMDEWAQEFPDEHIKDREQHADRDSAEGKSLKNGIVDDEHSSDHNERYETESDASAPKQTAEEEPAYNVPTTLLAELQLRKEQQRSRNRTAATAFPNGMHSTLLQLDAVAQVESQKRKGQRTTLAWEDPALVTAAKAKTKDDEDVPLGMLFPRKEGPPVQPGMTDWDRPLGLLEKRNLEDNEPLSRRRNRLKGIPNSAKPQVGVEPAIAPVQEPPTPNEDPLHEGETLAQRTRRLKSRKALDEAIGDNGHNSTIRPVSQSFSTEMLSQLGVKEETGDTEQQTTGAGAGSPSTPHVEPEEETLGQRRKRLQGQGMLQPNLQQMAPPLRSQLSLATLLSANPISSTNPSAAQAQRYNGLLGASEQARAAHQSHLYWQNQRSVAGPGMSDQPLINLPPGADQTVGKSKSGLAALGIDGGEPLVDVPADMNTGIAKNKGGLAALGVDGGQPFVNVPAGMEQALSKPKNSFMNGRFNDGEGGLSGQALTEIQQPRPQTYVPPPARASQQPLQPPFRQRAQVYSPVPQVQMPYAQRPVAQAHVPAPQRPPIKTLYSSPTIRQVSDNSQITPAPIGFAGMPVNLNTSVAAQARPPFQVPALMSPEQRSQIENWRQSVA